MSKRICTSAGVIQRENFTSSAGVSSMIAASSLSSRTAATRCAASPSPSSASTAPPGNTHTPPMNRALGVRLTSSTSSSLLAPAEHLACAVAQQDHARGLARRRGRAGVVRLPGRRSLALARCAHPLTLPAANLWRMSDDRHRDAPALDLRVLRLHLRPRRRRPGRRHPAGTAFEDIPDTWFCPVCGARKRDFTLYED